MKPNILIVDDEINIRLMLRTILEGEGYSVTEASNGSEALSKLRLGAFDLMLLDLNMPVMDGLAVLETLQADPVPNSPRVVVLTAYGSISTAVRATRLGALDFVEKPASPEILRSTIAAVMKEPQPAKGPSDLEQSGYSGVIERVRKALRIADVQTAEMLLMKAADLALDDAPYLNLLGVICEMRQQWRLAKKFYTRAMRANKSYAPAEENLKRLYELNTYGRSSIGVALGDEMSDANLM